MKSALSILRILTVALSMVAGFYIVWTNWDSFPGDPVYSLLTILFLLIVMTTKLGNADDDQG